MSYFDANFDEKSFKKELDRVVKLHLKKAVAYKLGEPLAIIEAKCAIALVCRGRIIFQASTSYPLRLRIAL